MTPRSRVKVLAVVVPTADASWLAVAISPHVPLGTASAPGGGVAAPSTTYIPRQPGATALYEVVRDHFETFRAQAADGSPEVSHDSGARNAASTD